jgi:DnaJ-class molecular chaperone
MKPGQAKGDQALPILEQLCYHCDGLGLYDDGSGARDRCTACGGSGYIATESGERILALMRHNLKPMLQDAKAE